MKLINLIENYSTLSDEGIVFAERVNGKFSGESEAVVIEMDEEELTQKTSEIAHKRAPGKEYFLEVFIIQNILEDWGSNNAKGIPLAEAALETIINYAENDA